MFVVTAPDGDFNLPRIERLLALVRDSGAAPVIILNKADLADDVPGVVNQITAFAPGVSVHAISARSGDGIFDVERYFDGNRTIGLIGSSGVGKSTLTNKLTGYAEQETQEVRVHDSRGRHTTTHRQLFTRPRGGAIIDTPGMRGLELWNPENDVDTDFDDIETSASGCRFRNCKHDREPGCAVRDAVERGGLDAPAPCELSQAGARTKSALLAGGFPFDANSSPQGPPPAKDCRSYSRDQAAYRQFLGNYPPPPCVSSNEGVRREKIMPFPRGVIDNDGLNRMQQAMTLACNALEVSDVDEENRKRVAFLVTGFMHAGISDPELLTNYVVYQYRQPEPKAQL